MAKDRLFTITGGSGFIRSRLCQLMADRELDFEIVDLKPSRSFPDRSRIADIRDIEALRGAVAGNVIINLAAVHRDDIRDRSQYYTTNVDGTRNLCILATERGIDTMVFTSTVAVYGFCPPDADENGATNPFNDYGRSNSKRKAFSKAGIRRPRERASWSSCGPPSCLEKAIAAMSTICSTRLSEGAS